MDLDLCLFDAFTRPGPLELNELINFVVKNTADTKREQVAEAVEYALKNKPSFGGFILTAKINDQLIATLIANKTGMEGYNPTTILVYNAIAKKFHKNEQLIGQLLNQALQYSGGDLAIHLKPDNPTVKLFKRMGFTSQYVAFRLEKEKVAVA